MLVSHKPMPLVAVMALVVFTVGQCQENESRRAVTEHQLMNDRGRSMQSLKRLIWLSSAMEGLHTAQARSSLFPSALMPELSPPLTPHPSASQLTRLYNPHKGAMKILLKDFLRPHINGLPDGEP